MERAMPYRSHVDILGPFIVLGIGMVTGVLSGLGVAASHWIWRTAYTMGHFLAYCIVGLMVGGIAAVSAVWMPWVHVTTWEGLIAFSGIVSAAACLGVGFMHYFSEIDVKWKNWQVRLKRYQRNGRSD